MGDNQEAVKTMFVAHPVNITTSQPKQINMFSKLRSTQPLQTTKILQGKTYEIVGPSSFKQKYLQPPSPSPSPSPPPSLPTQSLTLPLPTPTPTQTIPRTTTTSKQCWEQTNIITKQTRSLSRYKEYKTFWHSQSQKLQKHINRAKGNKSLLQANVPDLYVDCNQNRIDVVNDFVVHFWDMSLRNNNKILKRHIKGHRFGDVELEQMLQTQRGTRKVQNSIPVLPIDKLRSTTRKELSLTGRNKAMSETRQAGFSGRPHSQISNQEQVYKISYTSNMKWLGESL